MSYKKKDFYCKIIFAVLKYKLQFKKKGGRNMKEEILEILLEMNQKLEQMNKRLDGMDERLEEMDEKINEVQNQQFLFEHEYGTKIDAIFDAVTLELDKNLEKSEKIRKLEGRMDRNEVTIFSHEKRISNLELNQ